MGALDNDSEGSSGQDNALSYPLASSSHVTVWLSENDSGDAYFSIKLEPPMLATHSFNVYPTERAGDFLNRVRDAWCNEKPGDA